MVDLNTGAVLSVFQAISTLDMTCQHIIGEL